MVWINSFIRSVPITYLEKLYKGLKTKNMMDCAMYGTRSTASMTLDRLYSAYRRRIMTTAKIIELLQHVDADNAHCQYLPKKLGYSCFQKSGEKPKKKS